MMAPSTVIAPEALQMQLDLLRLAFPRWEINCCGYDRDSWFEAKRRVCAGNCRCMLVAGWRPGCSNCSMPKNLWRMSRERRPLVCYFRP